MCGIVGFVGERNDAALLAMRDALLHRGPDDCGMTVDGRVSLGHRRLAIIDRAGGTQPCCNEDGSVVLVFNGEIYNHRVLRDQLVAAGHRFSTDSDTETIVHAYEEWGDDCVNRLDGMFAFVLHDRQRCWLFGARDRMGKKPFYFTTAPLDGVSFAFASELKALRQHPEIERSVRLSMSSLRSYLLTDYIGGRASIFENIAKLEPGHALSVDLSAETPIVQVWRWYALPPFGSLRGIAEPKAIDRLVSLFAGAVERRLMADVPLGVFLSGGIDSSAVLAALSRIRPGPETDTFSIGFDDPSFDESKYCELAARHFKTRHHQRTFSADDLLAELDAVTAMLDEPFADPSMLPTSLLCRFARDHVTVAIGGDGGDELFAGYDPFLAIGPASYYDRLVPRWLHERLIQPASRFLPARFGNMPVSFRVRRFLRGMSAPAEYRLPVWLGPFDLPGLARIAPALVGSLSPEAAYGPMIDDFAGAVREAPDEPLAPATRYFLKHYLPDDILTKVDRASMMHSLEVRAPFLDRELVEFVQQLPGRFKLRCWQTKYLLRQATAPGGPLEIPRAITQRPKKGFGMPVARWIRGRLRESFQRVLVDEWPQSLGMFDRAAIGKLLDAHVRGADNHYKELWSLFMLAQWTRRHWR